VSTPVEWRVPDAPTYFCRVHLAKEAGGGFSVYAATLPGVASQGDTEEEALANVAEAFRGCIESYQADGRPIPWLDVPRPLGRYEFERWVEVSIQSPETGDKS
jgi:predicted RNase H-like HicB family nuclease